MTPGCWIAIVGEPDSYHGRPVVCPSALSSVLRGRTVMLKHGLMSGLGPSLLRRAAVEAVSELVRAGLPRRQAADLVSRLTGQPRNRLYRDSL